MPQRYVNAAEMLPEELLTAVRERLGGGGCTLWIPTGRSISRERRNEFVVNLYSEGYSSAEIAERLFISQRTVFRILAAAKSRKASGKRTPPNTETRRKDGVQR